MSLAKVRKNGWLTLVLKGISSFLGGQMMSDFLHILSPARTVGNQKCLLGILDKCLQFLQTEDCNLFSKRTGEGQAESYSMCWLCLCHAGTVLGTRGDSFLICTGVTIPLYRQLAQGLTDSTEQGLKVTCILATAGMPFHYTLVLIYNKTWKYGC